MFIPVGYVNVQFLFLSPNGRLGLTAVGAEALGLAVENAQDAWGRWAGSDFWENMDSDWNLVGCRLIVGASDPSEPVTIEWVETAPGGNAGAASPPNTAMLVKKGTSRGGRKGRGRMFVPGLPADYVADTGFLAGVQGVLNDQFNTLMTGLKTDLNDAELVLLHSEPGDGDPDVITSFTVDNMVATQRRRLRG